MKVIIKYHHMKDFWIYKLWFDYCRFTEGSLRQRECFCSIYGHNGASKKFIIKHAALETPLMLYHQLILPPNRCGYLNSQLGFVCTHFSSAFKYVCLCSQSIQPLHCHDELIYTWLFTGELILIGGTFSVVQFLQTKSHASPLCNCTANWKSQISAKN